MIDDDELFGGHYLIAPDGIGEFSLYDMEVWE